VLQGSFSICGGWEILFFANHHSIKFKPRLREGSNNYAKLMALKLVLLLANEKGINNLKVFGDSQIITK